MTSESKIHKPFMGMRKVFHVVTSSAVPLFYWFLPFMETEEQGRAFLLTILIFALLLLLVFDGLRLLVPNINRFLMAYFSMLIRQTEEKRFTGATFTCLSFLVVTLLFPREIAVTAMLFLTVGDTAAEIAGKNWGRTRYFGRSLEGMAGFFLFALPVAWLIIGDWQIALPGAAMGALIEFFSFRVDDNLTVPIFSAGALGLLTLVI